jgi:hypothetical protein
LEKVAERRLDPGRKNTVTRKKPNARVSRRSLDDPDGAMGAHARHPAAHILELWRDVREHGAVIRGVAEWALDRVPHHGVGREKKYMEPPILLLKGWASI